MYVSAMMGDSDAWQIRNQTKTILVGMTYIYTLFIIKSIHYIYISL